MKKPYYDIIDRKIMRETDTLSASQMKLFIAVERLKKTILKEIKKLML